MRKLLPLMENGVRFATAKKTVYGDYAGGGELRDDLPPVLQAAVQLRNPVVCRGLTELRKACQFAYSGIRQTAAYPRRAGA